MTNLSWAMLWIMVYLSVLSFIHAAIGFYKNGWEDLDKREEYQLDMLKSVGVLIVIVLMMIFMPLYFD